MNLLQGTLDYADLADADLVIEAVFEDLSIKQQVFRTLDRVVRHPIRPSMINWPTMFRYPVLGGSASNTFFRG